MKIMIDTEQFAADLETAMIEWLVEAEHREYAVTRDSTVDARELLEKVVEYIKTVETPRIAEIVMPEEPDDEVYYRWTSRSDNSDVMYSSGSIYSSPPFNERWDIVQCDKAEYDRHIAALVADDDYSEKLRQQAIKMLAK